MNRKNRITRRDFLKIGASGVGGLLLRGVALEKTAGRTYYVRKTGDDGNTGGYTDPWLTLYKALKVAKSGDTVKVGDGLYEESCGGIGYWNIIVALNDYLTIEAESGEAGDVRIQGASHHAYNTLLRVGYLKFRYLQFQQRVPTNNSAFFMLNAANIAHVIFEHCTFTIAYDPGTLSNAVSVRANNTFTIEDVSFTACDFVVTGTYTTGDCRGIRIGQFQPGGIVRNVTLTDCHATGSIALYIEGASDVLVQGGNYEGLDEHAILVGWHSARKKEGLGPVTARITLRNLSARTFQADTHEMYADAVLMGSTCKDCLVDGLVVLQSYRSGLVLWDHHLEGYGTEVKNCYLTGGVGAALRCQGARYAHIHDNWLVAGESSSAFELTLGWTNIRCSNVTLIHNTLVSKFPQSTCLDWGEAEDDAGGGVCDYNLYKVTAGTLGVVRGAAVTTLAELQAAWLGYDVSENDQSSVMEVHWHKRDILVRET